jgi:hypothetical protein
MAFKYRKRIRVFPGFYLNLSKSGMSATVGMKGLNVNFGKNGAFLNTGIPGTGIYERVRISGKSNSNDDFCKDYKPEALIAPNDAVEIKSYQPELITSDGLYGLKESILNAQKVKEELRKESKKLLIQKVFSLVLMVIPYMLIFGVFLEWFKKNYFLKNSISKDAKEAYQNFKLDIKFNMDQAILNDYIALRNNYEELMSINTIWDITFCKIC